jgi:hypothetical protein
MMPLSLLIPIVLVALLGSCVIGVIAFKGIIRLFDYRKPEKLIAAKMRAERPTLRAYLRSRAAGEAQSSEQWQAEHPGCDQAVWRAGASYAYRDIERMIERDEFLPENDKP